MTEIEEYAKEKGYKKLTSDCHPKSGDIVELLGSGIANPIKTIKAEWLIIDGNHSYRWLSHDHERGIPTITPEFWK